MNHQHYILDNIHTFSTAASSSSWESDDIHGHVNDNDDDEEQIEVVYDLAKDKKHMTTSASSSKGGLSRGKSLVKVAASHVGYKFGSKRAYPTHTNHKYMRSF